MPILYLEKRAGSFALVHESGALHSMHETLIGALEVARLGSWPIFYLGQDRCDE